MISKVGTDMKLRYPILSPDISVLEVLCIVCISLIERDGFGTILELELELELENGHNAASRFPFRIWYLRAKLLL